MAVLGIALGLVGAEFALRMTGLGASRGGTFTVTEQEFNTLPGIYGPSQDVDVTALAALPHHVHIDSLGYRGPELTREKPAGEMRVFYAGDSFVFGDFVDDDETLPQQTERALAAVCSPPVRVINGGLGGSSITEHVEMIRRGTALQPDLVLLLFNQNDVRDLAGTPMWDQLAANRAAKSSFPLSVAYPLLRNTALWDLTLRTVGRMREQARNEAFEQAAEADDGAAVDESPPDQAESTEMREAKRQQYLDLVTQLDEELSAQGIDLIVTIMPSHLTVYGYLDTQQLDWIDEALAERGIEHLSFYEALRADGRGETELYLLPHDGHASALGYSVVAEELARNLVTRAPVAAHCAGSSSGDVGVGSGARG